MKIIVGLLLIATALAYPVAENEVPKPGVPLVITDYSSVAKADEAKVPHSHVESSQSDSVESHDSSESVESEEKQPLAETKPLLEQKPVENKQEKPLSDEVSLPLPAAQEGKPVELPRPIVPEQKTPDVPALLPVAVPVDNKVEDKVESKKEKKEIAEEKKEELKPVVAETEQTKTIVEPVVEIKPAELVPEVKKIDAPKEEQVPALKSVVHDEKIAETVKPEESAPVPVLNPVPIIKTELPVADKVADEIFGEKVKEPLALPTQGVTHDVPASDDIKLTEEVIKPSEQKVEVSPVAEETAPQVQLTEVKPTEEVKPLILEDKVEEKKEVLPEIKNLESEKKAKAEGELEEKKPEIVNLEEKVDVPAIKKVEDIKPELKASVPEPKAESLPELKKEEQLPTVAPVVVNPKVEEPKKEDILKKEVLPEKLPEPSSASS